MKNIKLIINNDLKKNRERFFIKKELQSILNLYAKMVSNGSWKDYSFSLVQRKFLLMFIKELLKTCFKNFKNLKPSLFIMKNFY